MTGNDSPLENIKKNVFDSVQPEGAIGKIPTAIGNVNTTLGGIAETINKILIACEKDPNANTGDGNTANGNTANTNDALKNLSNTVVGSVITPKEEGSFLDTLSNIVKTVATNTDKNTSNTSANAKTKALDFIVGNLSKNVTDNDDINKVLAKQYDGKKLTVANQKKLAKKLGVEWDNGSKTGNLYKKLKSLKITGFKRGGVISVDNLEKQIKANGDTTLLSGNPGERMLTAKQNDLFEKFVGELPQLNQLGSVIKPLVDMPKIPNVQPANRNMNNIVSIDNITLPNVKNYDEFKTQMFRDMQTDRKFENMIENMSIDKLDKNYNSLKKLKHRF